MNSTRVTKLAMGSAVGSSLVPRLVVAIAALAVTLIGGSASAQGTFRLAWNSCAVGAPNSVLGVCTTGGTLVALVTPSVAMSGANLEALFEIKTAGPTVPNYILSCLFAQQFLVSATCPAADRLLGTGNTCTIHQVVNPVDGDASRVQFRVMANRPVNNGKALVAGHEYQAFAINFPAGDPGDPGCEGCNVPFRVFVVQDKRLENKVGPHYGMGLRAQLPPGPGTPIPVFMIPSADSRCISGNQTCSGTLAVDDRSTPNALGLSCAPNPARDALRLSYQLYKGSEVDLFVADLAGRSVVQLESGFQSPGAHGMMWDGRDESGRRLAPGVYWVTIRAEGRRSAVRIVMAQ
jgi:hypothetical protein